MPAKPSISAITLSVSDTEASNAFYRDGMGFRPLEKDGEVQPDAYHLTGGLVFSVVKARRGPGGGFALTWPVETPEELAECLASAEAAGGAIVTPAAETATGHRGRFSDPDGYCWDVVCPRGRTAEDDDPMLKVLGTTG